MKNMKIFSLAVIAFSTAMLSTSCLREDNFGGADSKFISLKVSTASVIETKSGSGIEPLEIVDLSSEGMDLFLFGSVKPNQSNPLVMATKAGKTYGYTDGEVVAADFIDEFDIQVASGSIYQSGKACISDKSKEYWSIYSGEKKLEWPDESATSHFLAYYPSITGTYFKSSYQINYNGNGDSDFLVAYTATAHDHDNAHDPGTYVSLTFKHPLALVKFHVAGSVDVSKIVINNAATSGVINAETLECTVGSKSNIEATPDATEENTFSLYVMPGATGNSGMNVTFYVGGKVLTTANLGIKNWEAGMIYNYTISDTAGADRVDIDLAKNDASTVTNEFTTAVYLRAAIIANWVDATGRIVDDAAPTLTLAEGWELNDEDGYYYYKDPVIGYQTADLISNIVPGSSDDDGAENLQVAVAVQAVEYDSIKTAKEAFAALNINNQ